MKDDGLEQVLSAARQRAAQPRFDGLPWPMALLSIVGAWLVAVPVLGMLVAILIALGASSTTPFLFVGVGLMVLALAVKAQFGSGLFAEQLRACCYISGLAMVAAVVYLDYTAQAGTALFLLTLLSAFVTNIAWLRAPLGAMSAVALQLTLTEATHRYDLQLSLLNFYALNVNVVLWLLVLLARHARLHTGLLWPVGLQVEAIADGWLVATCAGLAAWSGRTFLLDAQIPWDAHVPAALARQTGVVAAALVLAAAGWMLCRWPLLRGWRWCGAAVAVAGLAWFSPALGPVALCLAGCVLHGKYRLAVVAASCAAWIVGSAYYQLAWPLILKAQVFTGVGGVLLVCAWTPGLRSGRAPLPSVLSQPVEQAAPAPLVFRRYAGACLVLVLLLANVTIVQREYQIAHGAQVFVRLAPRDPRSLMQGDYMALRTELNEPLYDVYAETGSSVAVLSTDADGVAIGVQQWTSGMTLAPHDHLLAFEVGRQGAVLAADAWYFTEGDAERWAAARYGEYRIGKDGRAWLVGLRGEGLARL